MFRIGEFEVLQGYICNILLASHSTYEPSPYSTHWLDQPRHNRSQRRGKLELTTQISSHMWQKVILYGTFGELQVDL
jgi:hypothetical protein